MLVKFIWNVHGICFQKWLVTRFWDEIHAYSSGVFFCLVYSELCSHLPLSNFRTFSRLIRWKCFVSCFFALACFWGVYLRFSVLVLQSFLWLKNSPLYRYGFTCLSADGHVGCQNSLLNKTDAKRRPSVCAVASLSGLSPNGEHAEPGQDQFPNILGEPKSSVRLFCKMQPNK